MPKFFSSFRRLQSPARWFRKESTGSVLILVVALIVILALLGTAFVATARIDRFSAGTNASGQIITAQLQSLQSQICTDIANGLYDQSTGTPIYRPIANNPVQTTGIFGTTSLLPPTYGHFDSNRWTSAAGSPNGVADPNEWDAWLADRLPIAFTDSTLTNTNIVWRAISRLRGPTAPFYSLIAQTNTTPSQPPVTQVNYDPWGKNPLDVPTYLVPTAVALTYPRSQNENPPATPKVFPAFQMINAAGTPVAPCPGSLYTGPIIAADADGDGIADSLLFDLGVSSSSSAGTIKYFAAVRIVDNNSAVNLNTAWSRYSDFATGSTPGISIPPDTSYTDALGAVVAGPVGATNLGWFPSHVGLLEMLDPLGVAPAFPMPAGPQTEMAKLNAFRFDRTNAVLATPFDDSTTARSDYQYITLGDALWNELGRRIQNPAHNGIGIGTNFLYQAVNDNGELAFRFNLLDPSANPNPLTTSAAAVALTAPSNPERILSNSLYTDAINWTLYPTYNRWSVYPADKAYYWFDYNFNTANVASANLTGATGAATHDNEGAAASGITLPTFYRNLRSMAVPSNPVSNATPIHSYDSLPPIPTVQQAPRLVPVPPPGTAMSTWTQQYMAPYTNPAISPNTPGAAGPIKASLNTDQFPVLWRAFWNVMCDDNNSGSIPLVPGTAASSPAMTQIFTDPPDLATGVAVVTPKWTTYEQLLIRAAVAAVNVEGLRDQSDNVISRHIVLPDVAGVTVEVFSNKPQPYILSYDDGTTGPTPSGNKSVTLFNPMKTKSITLNPGQYQLAYYDPAAPTVAMATLKTSPTPIAGTVGANGGQLIITLDPTAFTGITVSATGEIVLLRSRGISPVISPYTNDPFDETSATNPGDNVPLDYVSIAHPTATRPAADWSGVQAVEGGILNSLSNRPQIQIFNDDFPGPYSPAASPTELTAGLKNEFPFGAFARVGDVLKVPFIGSYRVTIGTGAGASVYYVPISLDCAACNTQPSAATGEQIGHFCPPTDDPAITAPIADYDWTKKIFDYFTVIQNPGSDYSPNVNPNNAASGAPLSTLTPTVTDTWQTLNPASLPNNVPTPVPNLTSTAATPTTPTTANNSNAYDVAIPVASAPNEDNIGIDGLININTAPWQVLATLPMVPAGTTLDATGTDDNMRLAKAIVLWRDGDATHPAHGPFKSIFDLNRVTDGLGVPVDTFQNGWGVLWSGTAIGTFDSGPPQGDFSPYNGPDGLTQPDFEKRFLTLTRISNLITTRSDTFTCYVVVQGWLNAGSNNPNQPPTLVAQQRTAFIANRVAVGLGTTTVQTTTLPSAP